MTYHLITKRYFLSLIFVIFNINASLANESILDEITVISSKSNNRAMQLVTLIDQEELSRNIPTTLSDVFLSQPIVGVRSNSRGETILRLRGSNERQTAIFLDGASLSIPWDGRIDIGLLPIGMIDRLTISKGAVPIEYGSNAMLGAVEISTINDCDNDNCSIKTEVGSDGLQYHSFTNTKNINNYRFAFSGSYRRNDDLSYSKMDLIRFAPKKDGRRVNTDSESTSLWFSLERNLERSSLKLSHLLVDANKGIPPAGHIDPSIKKPRYWRYPNWNLQQTTLNLSHNFNGDTFIKLTSWLQQFEQTINQYDDMEYLSIERSENDKDTTKGLRLVLNMDRNNIGARLIGNYQTTVHYQDDAKYKSLLVSPREKYSQDLLSIGAELDASIGGKYKISFGSSYDYFKTPLTGNKKSQSSLSDWASNINFEWKPKGDFYAILSLGKRTRFPTLRELYGVALNKFTINPDLRPESAILTDLTLSWLPENSPASITTTFWVTKISDAISKRQIKEGNNLYDQRYNISGSKGRGLSFEIKYLFSEKLQMQLNGNLQSNKADISIVGTRPPILLQPETQLNLVADYYFSEKLSSRIIIQKIGGAIDEDLDGNIIELGSSDRIDVNFFINIIDNWKFYIAFNNINDSLVLPQLGFPENGRGYKVGFERLL